MDRTIVMGVLNVTPDSFSDGGRWLNPNDAIRHGLELIEAGADYVDVGGESTRPGSARPSVEDELARVLPVIEALADAGAVLSIDTMRAEVAAAAVAAGASLVNDVSGGLSDPKMFTTVADLEVDYVLQHWRAYGDEMALHAHYDDVVKEVKAELEQRVQAARAAGVRAERIIIDPGIGFAKDAEHNWAILANLPTFMAMGHRLLIGASRKRFLGELLDGRPSDGRDDATAAITAWCAERGVWGVRTHTVRAHCDAVAVIQRLAGEQAVSGTVSCKF